MKALFKQQGASLDINILASDDAQQFIEAHAQTLDSAFTQVKMSEAMRQRLQRSDYIFSGIKTFHELNEAFPSLLDENGNRKPFEQFLNDVRKIDATYNENYLRSEFEFAQASAEMAAKWETFMEDGDRYNLQYRTAGDDRVRPTHAALEGVTLPPSDPFWESYLPPNGWGCRCTTVQVRKKKYPETPHDEAMERGAEALQDDTKGMFRFNSGKEQKTFPDYNPYTISRCRDCDIAKGKLNLAYVPENQLCASCQLLHQCAERQGCYNDKEFGDRLKISLKADKTEVQPNIRAAKSLLRSFQNMAIKVRENVIENGVKNPEYLINDLIADRKGIMSPKGIQSGFKKAKAQGCQAVVIDLDMNMADKKLPVSELAKYLSWRHDDFEQGIIKECYVIHHDKAVLITAEQKSREDIRAVLEKLKL